jgi:hypothetical protein
MFNEARSNLLIQKNPFYSGYGIYTKKMVHLNLRLSLITLLAIVLFLWSANELFALEHESVLVKHVLSNELVDGEPQRDSELFHVDDTIYSWIELANVSGGDLLEWQFIGPSKLEYTETVVIKQSGKQTQLAMLNLDQYTAFEASGSWSLTIALNGEKIVTDFFKVDPLSGLWIPGIGFYLILTAFIIILTVLAVKTRAKRTGK